MSSEFESTASGSTPPTSLSENESTTGRLPSVRTGRPLRVACVQYDIKLRQPQKNLRKIKHLTKDIESGSLDLLVLPEMCLSGYIFTSAEQMVPYLEDQIGGSTYHLAMELAKRVQCHVIAGYPEKYVASEDLSHTPATLPDGGGVGYTSALIVSPEGEVIGNYRKSSLFVMDKCWAREGTGFMYFDLPAPIGRLGMAMCMDMNPRNFDAPWENYEVGKFAYEKGIDTLVVPMNWPDSHTNGGIEQEHDLSLPDEASLKYWAARLRPLHHPQAPDTRPPKEVVFITCNNVGRQEGILFVGTSCVMMLSPLPPHIEIVDTLTMSEEIVMITSVD